MLEKSATFNQILTNYAQGAHQNPDALDLSRLLFPAVQVEEAKGVYDKWGIAEHFSAVDTTLARHNSAHRIEISRTDGTYRCQPEAVEIAHWLPDMIQQSGPRYRENGLRALMDTMATSRNLSAVDILKAATPEKELKLGDDANVIEAIDSLFADVRRGTYGRQPSHLIMGRAAWNAVRNHKSVLDRAHGLAYAIFEDAFKSVLSHRDVQLVIVDNYAMRDEKLIELLGLDIVALYNEATPTETDLSAGKDFTLDAAGPEVHTYQEKGLYDVDMLLCSSDRQVTNTAAVSRLALNLSQD